MKFVLFALLATILAVVSSKKHRRSGKAKNHCGAKAVHFSSATLHCEDNQICCENGDKGQCVGCTSKCPTTFSKASDSGKHGSTCNKRRRY